MIWSLFNYIAALVPLILSALLVHLYISLWKSTTALSAMPHLVSGMNFLKNFVNLLMMSPCPCHCHLIFLSPVHHHHYHHHFHYASIHLSSTPDSKLIFSTNPFNHSLPHLFGRISQFLWPSSDLIGHRFLFLFSLFYLICVID